MTLRVQNITQRSIFTYTHYVCEAEGSNVSKTFTDTKFFQGRSVRLQNLYPRHSTQILH